MLGDATIERAKPTHNGRLRFDQTFPAHASYLTLLYVSMMNLVTNPPRLITRTADKRTGNVYSSLVFSTLAFPCFNYWHTLFYVDGRKVVPANISFLLTPRALAFWIMDDGGMGPNNGTMLHTNSFNPVELELLRDALLVNFGLSTRLSLRRPGQWAIHILPSSQGKLRDIVTPYMHNSMLYKICRTP